LSSLSSLSCTIFVSVAGDRPDDGGSKHL
jgi:hypothetical protein